MNPRLTELKPYPFERMKALKGDATGNPDHPHIALSIGEPKHPPPAFLVEALCEPATLARDLTLYPATRGGDALREAIAGWLKRRFNASVDPERQILPVAGTREALFSFGQAVLGSKPQPVGVLPNPFYQIYEGAILLGGAAPHFVNCTQGSGYLPDYRAVPEEVWKRCELVFVCSPGNPTGRHMPRADLAWLIEQAHRHDFVIAADECYSEIYFGSPPVGLLEVAAELGLDECSRCVVFHSLSKRSNLPGLRSGFVAGDPALLEPYFTYRTYEGCALGEHVQRASVAAWQDEAHVEENRDLYRRKFERITPILSSTFDVMAPDGAFYHWLDVGGDDQAFTLELFREEHITVLPGSFLGREASGRNPGQGHVRVAWVAPFDDCVSAANRLVTWAAERGDRR